MRISILTNALRIITIILIFDTKRGAMGISAIDDTILEISSENISQEEEILPSASWNGNDNFKREPLIPKQEPHPTPPQVPMPTSKLYI